MQTQDKIVRNNLDTIKHIHEVRNNIYKIIQELDKRAQNHDKSKLESPEQEIFGEHSEELGKVEYGTPEYQELLNKVKPAIEHHYSKNTHHPEHWPDGIDEMDLLDICEMLADWIAATQRNKNGNIHKSIDVNAKRFNMSPQLKNILENTVHRIFR